MIPQLTAGFDFHAQALVLRAERQRVVASNIANADTPGYQARDFDFATALREASGRGKGLGGPIAGDVFAERAGSTTRGPRLQYTVATQSNLDGNAVDMDRERAAFLDNGMKYEATLRFINGNVRTMLDAMKSHNQG